MRPITARKHLLAVGVLVTAIAVVAAACTPSTVGPPAASGPVTTTVVQAGNLQPAPAAAQPTGWDTAESVRGQLTQLARFDSSGPNSWDPKVYPLVYMASEGKGYGHRPSATNTLPGVQVIDPVSKKVIASTLFDLGNEILSQPHGLGASPDGKWLYVGFSDRVAATKATRNLILVVEAKTLKLNAILAHPTQRLHHIGGFKDWKGNDRVVLNMGFGANGGPHFVLDPKDNNKVVTAITYDNVRPMGHPYTAPDPTGKFLYISMGAPEIREADSYGASVAKFDLETKAVTVIHGTGSHPIGIAHSADGKFTYVNDGTNSLTFKIDNATNKVIGKTGAGVAGPYGIAISWDGTKIFTMGKGEGTHNTGGVVGVIDTKTFSGARDINQPINLEGSIIDHGILSPDPAANELWVSSAGTWETIVLDLKTYKVKARIASPNGGDTHGSAFVRYNADFTGELLVDMLGPKAAMFATMKSMAAAVK